MTVRVAPVAKCVPILKASNSDREILERLRELTDAQEPKIRDAFLRAVEAIRGQIDERALREALESGATSEALRIVNEALERQGYRDLANTVRAAIVAGGNMAVQHIKEFEPEAMDIRFDLVNEHVARFVREYEFRLIRQLDEATREAVAAEIRDGVINGTNPRTTAIRIRENIGLTARQETAVRNFRRMLEEGDADALQRLLRDRRFDGTLRRAISGERMLTSQQIDRMVERYRERYLKYRSEVIGRTESIRAVSAGNHEMWRRAVLDGQIAANRVRRKWIYTPDNRTRHAHVTIPALNPDGVGIEEPFQSELGPILYPGDPNARPANTIMCRCAVVTRIV